VGVLGIIGLVILILGLGAFFAAYNYDTLIANRPTNFIGPNQQMAVLTAAAVAAIGGGLFAMTLFGLGRGRGQEEAEYASYQAQSPAAIVGAVTTTIPASRQPAAAPPARAYREAPPARAAPPPPAPPRPAAPPPARAAPPARAPPSVAAMAPITLEEDIDEEEEEEAMELPAAAPEHEASSGNDLAEVGSASAASRGEKDELEDLFGELENEVAASSDEEIHYECPNCHGIVNENDSSCPHCHVVFEGA